MFSTLIVICSIAIIFVACDIKTDESEKGISVFLINSTKDGLVDVKIDIDAKRNKEKVNDILNILSNGINKADVNPSIINPIEVYDFTIEDKNIIINFNAAYNNMDDIQEILCRTSIVKSLTELNAIDTVEFYIEGLPKKATNGALLGKMSKDDVVYNKKDIKDSEKINIILYYSDYNSEYLVPKEVEITINPNEQLEKTILNKLIDGSSDKELGRTVPVETKIKNVYTNEGVCTVDFSKEFKTKHSGGSAGEIITIYSIVNSLTELPNIDKVQFLIEGEVQEEFKGHIKFNDFFVRNLDIVKK
jgi:germination protein M